MYVITNTDNGKLYVGSATGRNGIYQRWQDYIRDGHGNDTGLIAIVKQHGLEYVQTHFRYTLLEHYDFTVPKDVVLARESYWKEALDTQNLRSEERASMGITVTRYLQYGNNKHNETTAFSRKLQNEYISGYNLSIKGAKYTYEATRC